MSLAGLSPSLSPHSRIKQQSKNDKEIERQRNGFLLSEEQKTYKTEKSNDGSYGSPCHSAVIVFFFFENNEKGAWTAMQACKTEGSVHDNVYVERNRSFEFEKNKNRIKAIYNRIKLN